MCHCIYHQFVTLIPCVIAGQLNERTLQGYLEGLRCLHELGYVHCYIEPRHLCMSAEGCPAIIDLGEARALGVNSNSPRKARTYRGTLCIVDNVVRSYLGYLYVRQNPFMQFVAACSC